MLDCLEVTSKKLLGLDDFDFFFYQVFFVELSDV